MIPLTTKEYSEIKELDVLYIDGIEPIVVAHKETPGNVRYYDEYDNLRCVPYTRLSKSRNAFEEELDKLVLIYNRTHCIMKRKDYHFYDVDDAFKEGYRTAVKHLTQNAD